MKNILEQIAEIQLKTALISMFGGMGCIIFPLIGLLVIVLFFILLPFLFDNTLAADHDLYSVQDGVDERITQVQEQVDADYPSDELQIDGSLIAATLQVTTTYNQKLNFDQFNEDFDAANFKTSTAFPTYNLLYDMAKGMIGTKMEITCTKANPDDPDNDYVYNLSYVKELVENNIEGFTKPSCDSGWTESGPTQVGYLISIDKYEKVYVPKTYLLKTETFGLTADQTEMIESYTDEIIDVYNSYRSIVYGDDAAEELEGVISDNSSPTFSSDGKSAFPIGVGLQHCLTSDYGWRTLESGKLDFHQGVDLRAATGTKIRAIFGGTVSKVYTDPDGSCGLGVRITFSGETGDNMAFEYCHFSKVEVSKGDKVSAGDTVGLSGNTGHSEGPHLHMSMMNYSLDRTSCISKYGYAMSYDEFNSCYINPLSTLNAIEPITACP